MSDQLYPSAHMGDPKPQPMSDLAKKEHLRRASTADTKRLRAMALDSASRIVAGHPLVHPTDPENDALLMARRFSDFIETGEI